MNMQDLSITIHFPNLFNEKDVEEVTGDEPVLTENDVKLLLIKAILNGKYAQVETKETK